MACISVAMAVYNGERYLPEQLDSILCQLEEDDELVISYDASTDGTWNLLTEYASRYPQIKLFKNTRPGVTGNFSNAIAHCKGDYIFICDQDDKWAENKRASVVESFQSSGADVVIHNGVHIDEKGKIISEPFFQMFRIGNGLIRNILKSRYSGCCMAFTKAMARKILPIPDGVGMYDRWIGTVGELMGNICYNDQVLLYHRLHGDNVTASVRAVNVIVKERWILIKELIRRYRRERGRQ